MNDAIRLALLATAAMTTAACAVDGTERASADERTVSTSAAISTLGYAWWGTPGNNGAAHDLGSDADRTCFLQGVTGSLKGAFFGDIARVEVVQRDGRWWLQTKAGTGTGAIAGHAAGVAGNKCWRFRAPAPRQRLSIHAGNPGQLGVNRLCRHAQCVLT